MLPPKTHPRWRELVCGKVRVNFTLLATKFFMARVTGASKNDPSPENLARLIDEAYSFFSKNEKFALRDIEAIFGERKPPVRNLHTFDETAALIRSGRNALLAGDEALLRQLPRGNWVGGTCPYFIGEEGGTMSREKIFVTVLPDEVTAIATRFYDARELRTIAADGPDNGFTFLIIPAFAPVHQSFAENVRDYAGIFDRPLLGWIAGSALKDADRGKPLVFDGRSGESSTEHAVAVHATLRPRVVAEIGIVNLFTPDGGDSITVDKAGFSCTDACVNGVSTNLAQYLVDAKVDTRLPLVADYFDAMVNVSVRSIDATRGEVSFYAPLFPNVTYRLARPVENYEAAFSREVRRIGAVPTLAMNCILNYTYGALEGKCAGDIRCPVTFGEIAYGLLNQTLVYMVLRRV